MGNVEYLLFIAFYSPPPPPHTLSKKQQRQNTHLIPGRPRFDSLLIPLEYFSFQPACFTVVSQRLLYVG